MMIRGRLNDLWHRIRLGFPFPPYDGMQKYRRMKFLYDCAIRYRRPGSVVALEIGVCKACSRVYLPKACLRLGVERIYGIDFFTGTPSWKQTFDTLEEVQDRLRQLQLLGQVKLIRTDS